MQLFGTSNITQFYCFQGRIHGSVVCSIVFLANHMRRYERCVAVLCHNFVHMPFSFKISARTNPQTSRSKYSEIKWSILSRDTMKCSASKIWLKNLENHYGCHFLETEPPVTWKNTPRFLKNFGIFFHVFFAPPNSLGTQFIYYNLLIVNRWASLKGAFSVVTEKKSNNYLTCKNKNLY